MASSERVAPGRLRGGAPGGRVQRLVDVIIASGHLPTQCSHSTVAEKQLAVRLIRARKAGSLSSEQEAALDNLAQRVAQHRVALRRAEARIAYAGKLMQEVRDLGHYPKKSQIRSLAEQLLAGKLRWARKAKKFSPEQEAELKALQQAEMGSSSGAAGPAPGAFFNPHGDYDLSILRKRIDTLAKALELRDPIRRFASKSQSRIEQNLLMLQSGIGTKELLRRWAIYKKLVKLRKARKTQRFSPAQEAELKALQQVAKDAIAHGKAKGKAYSAFSHCQKRKRCGET